MKEETLRITDRLINAIGAIEQNPHRIVIVIDDDGKLLGTLTDGDIRRCLLNGATLQTQVSSVMNPIPLSAPVRSSQDCLVAMMRRGNVLALPLIDEQGQFVKTVHLLDFYSDKVTPKLADFAFGVIMAGGEGTRLRPITEKIPKPMVDIGGMPLLERQVRHLEQMGLQRLYISINYLAHLIEEHFGDGSNFGLDIRYLREPEKLGTGGALSLLPERPVSNILVMNGDILTTSDFHSLSDFHRSHQAELTVAAVQYNVEIPFGVIQNEGKLVTALVEKPSQRFFCNAGIYVLSPSVLEYIPEGQFFNMTDLVNTCLAAERTVVAFPLHEYWNDVGTQADLDKARSFLSEKS